MFRGARGHVTHRDQSRQREAHGREHDFSQNWVPTLCIQDKGPDQSGSRAHHNRSHRARSSRSAPKEGRQQGRSNRGSIDQVRGKSRGQDRRELINQQESHEAQHQHQCATDQDHLLSICARVDPTLVHIAGQVRGGYQQERVSGGDNDGQHGGHHQHAKPLRQD